ncbi:MAG: hypothetical protein BWZ09_02101 [Alphaproteobacteria bacterium ADurb.BinA305]|nr:MAG: hypothetical protein BWZ09_02101 [Alphaproteobacteria bacterium ADurb.BinA305]
MKERFRERDFRPASLDLIARCAVIIETYAAQGLRLTLRQLYYQLVSANMIPNEEKSYKNLGSLVSDARLAGLLDWDAIEDRVRVPKRPSEWDDLGDIVNAVLHSYRLPRWKDQPEYVELWVEKDALAGVLAPIATEYHVTLMVNRGYSSQSAMYEAGRRFKNAQEEGKGLHLLYLGDHDPSGEDMVRDVADRLAMFGVEDLDVDKLALTMTQIRQYKPPPNPAKVTDSRAKAYIEKHGEHSWEVDALPPNVLAKIIRSALAELVDDEAMGAVKAQEQRDKERLRAAVAEIMRAS